MARYKEVFPAIDGNTIFAYNGDIYTDNALPDHLIVHESVHLRQQEERGLNVWVENYLTDPEYRLRMEIEAYREQIYSIKDREKRNKIRIQSAQALASPLYGNIINFRDAVRLLK